MLVSSQTSIKGVVVNQNNKPIELAEVLLVNKDSITIKNEFTKPSGAFSLAIEKGAYVLQLRQLGKIMYKQTITVIDNLDLGTITITESKQQLEEVTVTSKKKLIERKVDRLVFNVENSISASGGDALDALRVTPAIKIQNDQIKMIGKSGMSVMVDDRIIQLSGDDLINFLKTIKSDDIKSIEVITTPPAKYNAEGNSGLINIKLKKAKKDSWNTTLNSGYKQATYATGFTGLSLNVQKNRLTVQSNVNYINGSIAPDEQSQIYYPTILWKENNKSINYNKSLSGKLALDYKISNKIKTGFQFTMVKNNPDAKDNTTTKVLKNEMIEKMITTLGDQKIKKYSNIFNYHLIYEMDTIGRKLSLDFDYFNYKNDSNRLFETNSYNTDGTPIVNPFSSANNLGNQNINNYAVNLDMEHPTNWASLNYGGRISFIKTANEFKYFDLDTGIPVFDPSQSNAFDYKENTQSLYISADKKMGEKWEAKLGVRYENTQTIGNSLTLNKEDKNSYARFFPTAYINYNPNDNHSFTLDYGKRINRPNFNFLNPFKWIFSPYSFSEGNPFLKPSFAHNIELNHAYKDLAITSAYFSYLDDGFEQFTAVDPTTNIQKVVPINFLINKTVGLNETINVQTFTWLKNTFYADVYYSATNSKIPISLSYLSGWNGEFSLNNDFMLNKSKTAFFNLSYSYTTAGVDALDRNTGFDQLNASFKLLLLNKKLQITLYGNDLFSSNRPVYTTYSNNIKNSFRSYNDARYFRLSLSYSFGKKFETSEERNKNGDEINRTN
jgi:outer membrane receptor protein involved in Fe transport